MVSVGRHARNWGAHAAAGIARLAKDIESRLRREGYGDGGKQGGDHDPSPDRTTTQDKDKFRPDESGKPRDQPDRFEKQLKTTDVWIAIFAGVSAIAAVVSSVVAIKTIQEMDGAAKQTDAAISKIAELAKSSHDEVVELTLQANNTGKLIGPAQRSADAAVASLQTQQRDFLADQRPRVTLFEGPSVVANAPGLDSATGRLVWNFTIVNAGKSTATNFRMIKYMSIGSDVPVDDKLPIIHGEIVRDKTTWTTAHYNGNRTIADITRILNDRHEPIEMYAAFTYEDEMGTKYKGTICERMAANGSIILCSLPDIFMRSAFRQLALEFRDRKQHGY